MEARDFTKGQRVQTHPATDAWMAGDRFGTVVRVGTRWVSVDMDRSGKRRRFDPNDLMTVEN